MRLGRVIERTEGNGDPQFTGGMSDDENFSFELGFLIFPTNFHKIRMVTEETNQP